MHAVAARAGFGCEWGSRHTDSAGVDAIVRVRERLDIGSVLTDFTMEFQLKATSRPLVLTDARYSFPMTVAHYNKLRHTEIAVPRYLAVLMLPQVKDEWLTLSADELICRRCVRWVSLRNAIEVDQENTTVYVPAGNVLSPDALRQLATKASKQEWIDYGAR